MIFAWFLTIFWICARTNYFAIVTRIHMNIHTFTHMFYFAHWSFVFNKLVFKRQMLVIVVVCGSASVKWILTLLLNKSLKTFVLKLFWKIHKFCVRLKLDFKFLKMTTGIIKTVRKFYSYSYEYQKYKKIRINGVKFWSV